MNKSIPDRTGLRHDGGRSRRGRCPARERAGRVSRIDSASARPPRDRAPVLPGRRLRSLRIPGVFAAGIRVWIPVSQPLDSRAALQRSAGWSASPPSTRTALTAPTRATTRTTPATSGITDRVTPTRRATTPPDRGFASSAATGSTGSIAAARLPRPRPGSGTWRDRGRAGIVAAAIAEDRGTRRRSWTRPTLESLTPPDRSHLLVAARKGGTFFGVLVTVA